MYVLYYASNCSAFFLGSLELRVKRRREWKGAGGLREISIWDMSRKRKEEGEGLEEPRKVCADKEERKKRKESWNCISACSNSRERGRKTNSQNFLHYLEIQRTWYCILGTDLAQECIKTVPFHSRAHLNPAWAVGRLKKKQCAKNVECYLVQETGFIFSSAAAG